MKHASAAGFAVCILAVAALPVAAQQTVGLFQSDPDTEDGYVLFDTNSPAPPHTTYLIDNGGRVVNTWQSDYGTGLFSFLRANGNLVRAGNDPAADARWTTARGRGGYIQEFDWDGNLIWEYRISDTLLLQHHDIVEMPNGNILIQAWEWHSNADAIAAGRDPATLVGDLWTERVMELEPLPPNGANVVWEWRVWDHLVQEFDNTKPNFGVVADHPELIDFNWANTTSEDWIHFNTIDYNAARDEIVLSTRDLSEMWVIDHSTTTAEAAGHTGGNSGKGGDLLYRYGNPQVYDRGTPADQVSWVQHDIQWIPAGYPGAGNFIFYNNGQGRPAGNFSTVDEFTPPLDVNGDYVVPPAGQPFGPSSLAWTYQESPATDLYSAIISGTQRQPNGNTLIIEGTSGHVFEVRSDGTKVWDYVNPVSRDSGILPQEASLTDENINVFKARRYLPSFAGFVGKNLTPGDPIESFDRPFPESGDTLRVGKGLSGDLDLTWDAASCPSDDYNVLWGDLADVSTYSGLASECAVGTTGSFNWIAPPAGSVFFLVVGTDVTGLYESSWGLDTSGAERGGVRASFTCGTTTKIVTSTCP